MSTGRTCLNLRIGESLGIFLLNKLKLKSKSCSILSNQFTACGHWPPFAGFSIH